MAWSKILENIRGILNKEDPDPWASGNVPTPEITHDDIEEAVTEWTQPKPERRSIMVPLTLQVFTLLWGIGHFFILYAMMGTAISGGIMIYVLVNLGLFFHYFMLLNKERKQDE